MVKSYIKIILMIASMLGLSLHKPMQGMQRFGKVAKRLAPKVMRAAPVAIQKLKVAASPVRTVSAAPQVAKKAVSVVTVQPKQIAVTKPAVVTGGKVDNFKRYLQATKPAQPVRPVVETKVRTEVKVPAVQATAQIKKPASQVRILSPFEQLYAMGYNPNIVRAAPKTNKQDNQLVKRPQATLPMVRQISMTPIIVAPMQMPIKRITPAMPMVRNYSVAPRIVTPVYNQLMLAAPAVRALMSYQRSNNAMVAVNKPSYGDGRQYYRGKPFNPMPFLIGSGVVGSVILYNLMQDNQLVIGQPGKSIARMLNCLSDGGNQLMITLKQRGKQNMRAVSEYMHTMIKDLRKLGLVPFLIDRALFRNLPALPQHAAHVMVQDNKQVAVAGAADAHGMVPVIMSEKEAQDLLGQAYDPNALHLLGQEQNSFGQDVVLRPLQALPAIKHAAIKFQGPVKPVKFNAPAVIALEQPAAEEPFVQQDVPQIASAQEARQIAMCELMTKAMKLNKPLNTDWAAFDQNLQNMFESYNKQLILYRQYSNDAYVVKGLDDLKQTILHYLKVFKLVILKNKQVNSMQQNQQVSIESRQ